MDHLEELIRDIENTDTPVPARYIVELAQYPGMATKLKNIDWFDGEIRIKADILTIAREGLSAK